MQLVINKVYNFITMPDPSILCMKYFLVDLYCILCFMELQYIDTLSEHLAGFLFQNYVMYWQESYLFLNLQELCFKITELDKIVLIRLVYIRFCNRILSIISD